MGETNDTLQTLKRTGSTKKAELPKFMHSPKEDFSVRMLSLGIPVEDMTQSVGVAVSALLEKIDDLTNELTRTRDTLSELEQLVDVDCIAPVPNRRAFMRRLSWAIAMRQRYNHPCSILYFDLNDFKAINDEHGHAAGDMAIRHVSKIFTDSLRGSDFMGRLSGDEFGVLMYYAGIDSARERGKKIAGLLAKSPFLWGSKPLLVTAACGAYEINKDDDAETALSHADSAMYMDKKQSKELAGKLNM